MMQRYAFSSFDRLFFTPAVAALLISQNVQNQAPPGEHSVMISVSSAIF